MIVRASSILFAVLLVVAAPDAATAAKIDVPGDHATFQEAVDAAESGDEIRVKGGSHGMVFISGKTNLTIRGKSGAVVSDFDILNCTDVRISRFVVAGSTGGAAVYIWASSRVTIGKCTIRDTAGNGVETDSGSEHVIEKCTFERNGRAGIALGGMGTEWTNDCVIRKNVIRDFGYVGIGVYDGARNLIEKNEVADSSSGWAFCTSPYSGKDTAVGGEHTFRKNEVRNCAAGFVIGTSRNRVEKNSCFEIRDYAYGAFAGPSYPGWHGTMTVFRKNRAKETGDAGLRIFSRDNRVEKNKVRFARHGIELAGDTSGNELLGNSVRDTLHGYWVGGTGHALERNRAKRSHGYGFDVSADDSTLRNNRSRQSGDGGIHDTGFGNTYTGNDFE
jgi:parallel beta-helix repeat protein